MKDKRMPAVVTAEAALVMGVILTGLMMLFFITVFLHDKAVLAGAVLESAQAAKERERADITEPADDYLNRRIAGKLLYFDAPACRVAATGDVVIVTAKAQGRRMQLQATATAPLSDPEKRIREKEKEREDE